MKLIVIGIDRGTMDGVQQYFVRAGAGVRTTAHLEDAHACAVGADAVILFADHYSPELSLRTVIELAVSTVIVVTAEVGYYSAARTAESVAPRVFVLRSPVWGWTLLDAVRSGLGGHVGES
ncbi:MAG TPA: hypothetical protein VM686_40710 [Polyangiaceae bacterium]|nr:hypothetical protein [Polyangiaceae bacterium]